MMEGWSGNNEDRKYQRSVPNHSINNLPNPKSHQVPGSVLIEHWFSEHHRSTKLHEPIRNLLSAVSCHFVDRLSALHRLRMSRPQSLEYLEGALLNSRATAPGQRAGGTAH
jgi:hypothetical protein